MTTPYDLERAVERLSDPDLAYDREGDLMGHLVDCDDLRLLLSERAELLATVERMRGALKEERRVKADLLEALRRMVEIDDDEVVMDTASVKERLSAARAALTTGEEK